MNILHQNSLSFDYILCSIPVQKYSSQRLQTFTIQILQHWGASVSCLFIYCWLNVLPMEAFNAEFVLVVFAIRREAAFVLLYIEDEHKHYDLSSRLKDHCFRPLCLSFHHHVGLAKTDIRGEE